MRYDPERLSRLNWESFTVEECAYALHMWVWFARLCLNTGVRQGTFSFDGKHYAFNE
jgi:hypothetical protein